MQKILYLIKNDTDWQLATSYIADRAELQRARNSREAFDLLRANTFDLVLLNIDLGDMQFDGIDVCKVIKQHPDAEQSLKELQLAPFDNPVIFVSSSLPTSVKQLLLGVGGDEVVTHLIELDRLISPPKSVRA